MTEAVRLLRDGNRLYPIWGEGEHCIFTGLTRDNQQVVMGLSWPDFVAIFFSMDGDLEKVEKRRPTFLEPDDRGWNVFDPRLMEEILAWQKDLGLRPALVRVKKFFVLDEVGSKEDSPWDRSGIGIEDYPPHFQDFVADPDAEDEEGRRFMRRCMEDWERDEQFVLWWGNDYWLDKTGKIVSS
jgi:hypothetical protein